MLPYKGELRKDQHSKNRNEKGRDMLRRILFDEISLFVVRTRE